MKLKTFFIALFFLGVSGVGTWLIYKESQKILSFGINSWTEDHRADCAVVLTGGPGRIREGFDLLVQKSIRKLIISGVYPGATLREIFPQWPYYGSLNPNDVILEKRSRTTYGNAQQSVPLIEALHCRDLILITSRIHMYRSQKIFTSVFPEGFPIYPRSVVSYGYRPKMWALLFETLKSLFYSIWAY